MLDGLEIFQALTHLMPYEELDPPKVNPKGRTHKEIEEDQRDEETKYFTGNITLLLRWQLECRSLVPEESLGATYTKLARFHFDFFYRS